MLGELKEKLARKNEARSSGAAVESVTKGSKF
jgi:hypothetical protein